MSDYTKKNVSIHRYKPQRSIDRSRRQRSIFAEKLLGRRYKLDHALGSEAVAGAGAGSSPWSGGGNGCKGAIGNRFAGGGTMTKDEGVVIGYDGNGSVRVVADQESTRLVGRGSLAAPKSGIRIHTDADVCRIGWMRPGAGDSVSHLVRSGRMTHVLSDQQDNQKQHSAKGSRGMKKVKDSIDFWKFKSV